MTEPTQPMMVVGFRDLVDLEHALEVRGEPEAGLLGAITNGAIGAAMEEQGLDDPDNAKVDLVGLAPTDELIGLLTEHGVQFELVNEKDDRVTEVWLGVYLSPTVWSTLLEKGEPAGLIPENWMGMFRFSADQAMHLDLSLAEVGVQGQMPMALPPGDMPWFVNLLDHCEVDYSLTYLPAGSEDDE